MKKWRKVIVFAAFFALGLSLFSIPAQAATLPRNIGISPLRSEYEIDAGTLQSGTLLIKNGGTDTLTVDMSAEAFSVQNTAYDYLFDPHAAEVSWVTFDQPTFVLEPKQTATVNYTIGVPLSAEPAGYYLALFATSVPSSAASGITPTERLGSLAYVTVPGDTTRTGSLLGLSSPFVSFSAPQWSATLQNSGSTHYRSSYSVTVTNVLGHQLSKQSDSRLILPNSVRLIEGTVDAPEILGLYKATYSIGLGDNPGRLEERWFLYLPPLQTGLLMGITIGIVYLFRSSRKKH